jgi:hypothetical protein
MIQLTLNTDKDFTYFDHEINRFSGTFNGDFMHLDGEGPIAAGIAKARSQGRVTLLDAGCGTGYGLINLSNK